MAVIANTAISGKGFMAMLSSSALEGVKLTLHGVSGTGAKRVNSAPAPLPLKATILPWTWPLELVTFCSRANFPVALSRGFSCCDNWSLSSVIITTALRLAMRG